MSRVRLKQLAQDGATDGEVAKWNNTAGVWEAGTASGGIATGLASARPTADGTQGFYYATDTQALSYDDSSTWEDVGILVDDVTIEIDGTSGKLQLIDAGTIATTKLSATGTKNSTTFLRGDNTWDVPVNTPKPTLTKALTIETPTDTEVFPFFYTPVAITLTNFEHYVAAATNLQWQIMHNTTPLTGGIATHGTITTTTTATSTAPTTDPSIPADSYLWLDSSGVSGTPGFFHVTVTYTED